MKKRVLYRKQIDLLELAKEYLAKPNNLSQYVHKVRDAIPDLFYENSFNLKSDFIELIPIEELSQTRTLIDFLKCISCYGDSKYSGNGTHRSCAQILLDISNLIQLMEKQINQQSLYTVFFSWQSDIDNKFNRNFIEDALEKAIKQINEEKHINLVLDKDTANRTGSPDIVNSILEKIDNATLIVSDVSIIDTLTTKSKYIVNSNIMFELGYAMSSLSDSRVLMVMNKAFGDEKQLPFDLGLKRQISYYIDKTSTLEKRKEEKHNLINKFKIAIESIVDL